MPYTRAVNPAWQTQPIEGTVPPSIGAQERVQNIFAEIGALPAGATIAKTFDLAYDLAKTLDKDEAEAFVIDLPTTMDADTRSLAIAILDSSLEAHGIMPLYPKRTESGVELVESEMAAQKLRIVAEPDPVVRAQLWKLRWIDAQLADKRAAELKEKACLEAETNADLARANALPGRTGDAACLAGDILADIPVARILKIDEPDVYAELQRAGRAHVLDDRPWVAKIGHLSFGR